MAKLNKMELQAVAGSILKEVRDAKLPQLIQEWEQKKIEVEASEAYTELQNWLSKHNLDKSIINTYHLNFSLGLNSKPTVVGGLPSVQSIVDKLIIGLISDANISSLMERIKTELLTA
jgi:hypothetical protein